MANINIGAAYTKVTTLANIPITYPVVYAEVSSSTNLSFSETPVVGQTISIFIKNIGTADFTQILPNNGSTWFSIKPEVTVKKGEYVNIKVNHPTSTYYVISHIS